MKLRSDSRALAPRELATRAIGVIGLAGGALTLAAAVLPPAAEGSDAIVIAIGAASTALGLVMLLHRPVLGEVALGALTLGGTALITITSREAGLAGGAADNEILYLWVCLYAFYFLSLPNALFQLAAVGAAYAWLLSSQGAAHSAPTQWLVTMSTMLVAGMLIAGLRGNLYRLVHELSERASRDGLTGLLNRRALEERYAVERARSVRDRTPLSVLAVDLDEFKALNDTAGHPTGDKALRLVATALQHWTREIDATARVGGDEFAVLLPGTEPAEAIAIAEDLRSAIARSPSPGDVRVTVSVGVATSPPPAPEFAELWQVADAGMYEGKRSGGDRVRYRDLAGEPAREPSPIPVPD